MAERLRKGDEVVVISGKEKGKRGKIKEILVEEGKVIVAGLNLVKRHTKPNARNQAGGIIEKEAPLWASKVMPVDPATGKPTRVRFQIEMVKRGDDGPEKRQVVRLAKSGEAIPSVRGE